MSSMLGIERAVVTVIMIGVISVVFTSQAMSARFSSSSYVIDASVMNNFGGQNSSSSYKMTSSAGESIIGNGAGGSYKIGTGYVAQLEHGISLSVQPGGLLGGYPLDETTMPSIYDNSANVFDGTAVGGPTSTAGKLGNALNFNGTSQYVGIGSSSSFTGTSYTLEAWVKTSTNSGTRVVVSKDSNFWLGIESGKAAIYDWTAGSMCAATSASSLGNGSWQHIVATLSSGTTNGSFIYINGVQQKACTWTPVAQNGLAAIGAAKGVSWQHFFSGAIDTVKIFNRAFTPNEVKAEYDAQNAGKDSGIHLGVNIAGSSVTSAFDAVVRTDAAGYLLAVSQDKNPTMGGVTIPSVPGSIGTPGAWTEGTTKGIGFTLYGTNATGIPAKWASGNAYAAIPLTPVTFYSRSGYSGGSKDYINMRLRLDTISSQASGQYQNTLTTTGTMIP